MRATCEAPASDRCDGRRICALFADQDKVRTLLAEQNARANDAREEYDGAVAMIGQEVYNEMSAAH